MKVIIDTNFLVIPFENNIDIYEEIKFLVEAAEIIVFDLVLDELKKVKPNMYKPVLDMLELKKIKITPVEKTKDVDSFILNYCKQGDSAIATNDKELKQKALKEGISIISVRGNTLQMR